MTPAAAAENLVARDRREGGGWTRGQTLKNALIAAMVRAAAALLVPLPRAALRAMGKAIGLLAWIALPRERRTTRENLSRALAPRTPSWRDVLRPYVTLGAHLGDAMASLDARTELEALAVEEASLALLERLQVAGAARRRGVVFASAHLGPWERVAATLISRGVPMTVLAREPYDPRLSWIYERLRGARGVPAIYRGQAGAAMRIVRTLRSGGVLGVPMDLRSRVPSVDVPFLGGVAPVPVGPARIALRTGSAVVVGTVSPDASHLGGLRITCTEILTSDLRADAEGERALTERLAAELTRRILALPGEWVWMHERFPGDRRVP